MRSWLKVASVLLGAALSVSTAAFAQEGAGAAAASDAKPAADAGGRKGPGGIKSAPTIQELEEMVIEGKIQKPEVFYILGRGETHYKMPILKESFVERIGQSVEQNPF